MASVQKMIDFSTRELEVTPSYLAALLSLSDQTLIDWTTKRHKDLPAKHKRLERLMDVIKFILQHPFVDRATTTILQILQNGRVDLSLVDSVTEADEFENSISLIGYVTAFPLDRGWEWSVRKAVNDYLKR